jgi:hypothetical protein
MRFICKKEAKKDFPFCDKILWINAETQKKKHTTARAYKKNVDKLNLIWQFNFRLKLIFATASAIQKYIDHFKSGQKWPENDLCHLRRNLRRHKIKAKYSQPFMHFMSKSVKWITNSIKKDFNWKISCAYIKILY